MVRSRPPPRFVSRTIRGLRKQKTSSVFRLVCLIVPLFFSIPSFILHHHPSAHVLPFVLISPLSSHTYPSLSCNARIKSNRTRHFACYQVVNISGGLSIWGRTRGRSLTLFVKLTAATQGLISMGVPQWSIVNSQCAARPQLLSRLSMVWQPSFSCGSLEEEEFRSGGTKTPLP